MNMKRNSKAFGRTLGLGLLLLACSFATTQDVKTNYMPGTDFSAYKTYQWVAVEGAKQPDQIVDQEIKQAINGQLQAKGFTLAAAGGKADLYVAYQVALQDQRQWSAYGTGRLGGGMGTATSSTITNGTLAVDFYDPVKKELLWRGEASKTLDPSSNPQKNQERLNKAVAKLLKNFPPTK
jgi:Domain of unknown function (DUF4136)